MLEKSTVAVCDILAFSKTVQTTPLREVVSKALDRFRRSLHHSVHKCEFPAEPVGITDLTNQKHLGVACFSDTILLYTKQDTFDSTAALTSALGWLFFENMFSRDTRLRCAVSYGEVYMDPAEQVFVGQPLIDAYRLEKEQEWSGGALTTSASERVCELGFCRPDPDWWLVRYQVPVKNGQTIETLAIDWTWGLHGPVDDVTSFLQWSDQRREPQVEDWLTHPDVCRKWANTRRFHSDVCRQCPRKQHTS
jgi:hypothetical protein